MFMQKKLYNEHHLCVIAWKLKRSILKAKSHLRWFNELNLWFQEPDKNVIASIYNLAAMEIWFLISLPQQ